MKHANRLLLLLFFFANFFVWFGVLSRVFARKLSSVVVCSPLFIYIRWLLIFLKLSLCISARFSMFLFCSFVDAMIFFCKFVKFSFLVLHENAVVEKYYPRLTLDFHTNKRLTDEVHKTIYFVEIKISALLNVFVCLFVGCCPAFEEGLKYIYI